MNDVKLLPHNEIAYNKLIDCLKDNQMVSINHATGTGKSFIMLKYLYENKNKKILYLAPTYQILDQLTEEHLEDLNLNKSDFNKFDTMIYRTLLSSDMNELANSYDIIVLDEYHRCGAKNWGKKVEELLKKIKENNKDTKVIGTTATEIRYLDDEKNMNEILFNNIEASRLSLSDAILQGILPVPTYVNFNYPLLEEIDELEKRIKKYNFYKSDLDDISKKILDLRNQVEETLLDFSKNNNYFDNKGKFLVFSSTIKNIEKDKNLMKLFLHKIDNSYSIHSNKSKIENKRILKEFRNKTNDETTVLYSVNMLNEGVHVKDVDALFMLRPTNSPIIYFQQLGRLLSYSRRKEQVVVFDFVNNISKNKVIYDLYDDLISKAKEYIKDDVENKERYQNIVNKFEIVDLTNNLCRKLDEYKTKYNKNNLIELRLNSAIEILLNERISNEVEKFQAQVDIFKYQNYITLEMFKRIKTINDISKPDIFYYSEDEFKEFLCGKRNIKERINKEYDIIYNSLKEYIKKEKRMPSIFSNDEEEKKLAILVFNNYSHLGDKKKRFILGNIGNNLSLLEIVTYKEIDDVDIDINILLNDIKLALNESCIIPYIVLSYIKYKISDKEYEEIIALNNKKQNINVISFSQNSKRNNILNSFILNKQFSKIENKCLEEVNDENLDEYVFNIFKDIYNFILKYKRNIDFIDKNNIDIKEREKERELFCKKIIFMKKLKEKGYIERLDELLLKTQEGIEKEEREVRLNEYIKFIIDHDGQLPFIASNDIKEKNLAKFFVNNYNKFTQKQIENIDFLKKNFNSNKEVFIKKYIDFFKEKRRKPLYNASLEERELLIQYNRWQQSFTKEERKLLSDVFKTVSKTEQMQKTYENLIERRNLKM